MKSAVTGYNKNPFYFDQRNEENPDLSRTVAWIDTEDLQEKIFFALVDVIGEKIDYLFKRNVGSNDDGIQWDRLQGGISKSILVEIIRKHRDWFFGDGGFEICVRKAESKDYFAYDDHGIFWIYSKNTRFPAVLEEFGFQSKEEDLICDVPHWHIYRKESDSEAESFRSDLTHASIYTND